MKKWIYDSKKWQDVFTCKPYEYLALVSQMKTPWFDKANNIWVDKDDYDGNSKEAIADVDAEIEVAKAALINNTPIQTAPNSELETFKAKIRVEDDDMPF